MFSDMSMLANETLAKHVNKDAEGFGEDFVVKIGFLNFDLVSY